MEQTVDEALKSARRAVQQMFTDRGVSAYAGGRLASALKEGDERSMVVVPWGELRRDGDGSQGVPSAGDLVEFAYGARFAVLVTRAAFGGGKVALVGEMGGLMSPVLRAEHGALWKCFVEPELNAIVRMPGEEDAGSSAATVSSLAEYEKLFGAEPSPYGSIVGEMPAPARGRWERARTWLALQLAPWLESS